MSTRLTTLVAMLVFAGPAYAQDSSATRVLDDFENISGWVPQPSDGVALAIRQGDGFRGRGMRLDFDFKGGGGYAVARKAFPVGLPLNYEFAFRIRGLAKPNNLEFKLVDPSGDNVWWNNQRNFVFPATWKQVRLKQRHIEFAWGPSGPGPMARVAAIEIAITAGSGGKGSVWIDELTLTPLEVVKPYELTPAASASSDASGHDAALALDGDSTTTWRSGNTGAPQWLALDFLANREYGGLILDWEPGAHATSYAIETSADGRRWESAYSVSRGNGGRDYIFLPETESRHVRLRLRAGAGRTYALRDIAVQPLAWSASRNAFFESVARDAPRGSFPKYLSGEQSYWTVIGVNGDTREGLINEEGAIESGLSRFSIEPFLQDSGRLTTWNDVTTRQSLEKGYLPIPSVEWTAAGRTLVVTTFAKGQPGASAILARYRVSNTSTAPMRTTLVLAVRPFQVNPSWQFLNAPGGSTPIRSLSYAAGVVRVNGQRAVIALTPPASFRAVTFDQGGLTALLSAPRTAHTTRVTDAFEHASGVLAYPLHIPAGASRDVFVELPLHAATPPRSPLPTAAAARVYGERALAANIALWDAALGRASIELPASGIRIARTLRSTLAYILINRDGPSIQPGSRSYERSWIRDGSLTSAALLRMGHPEEVREFIEWYAPFQYPDGKVPCCVDTRGADPVPENDSHGQLIFLIMEYYRYTHDRALLERMWPHVERAVAYMDSLRQLRRTEAYRTPEKLPYFGLVPQSISHEGYSAKPMHSYWDDAFVLKGLKDATDIAGVLGKNEARTRFAAIRDEFQRDLMASYRRAMTLHGIDYLPGAVELGDFDATSTTVSVSPLGALGVLPDTALRRTFQKYYENFVARRDGRTPWEGYTPYELRVVGTFVRLGWKDRAHELLDWFFQHQRPPEWNHWAEVVWNDPKTPKFIGDMPHTWVGSDFIRSVTDMFAYERESDTALVIGAGIRDAWVRESPGIAVRGLPTYYGALDYAMTAESSGPESVRVRISGSLRVPPGGIVVQSPYPRPLREALLDGARVAPNSAGEIVLRRVPADLTLRY